MGVFSFKKCSFCGKNLGFSHGVVLKDGTRLCMNCLLELSPLLKHLEHFNLPQIQSHRQSIEQNMDRFYMLKKQRYQEKSYKTEETFYIFFKNDEENIFAIDSPEFENYKYRDIFLISEIIDATVEKKSDIFKGKEIVSYIGLKIRTQNPYHPVIQLPYFKGKADLKKIRIAEVSTSEAAKRINQWYLSLKPYSGRLYITEQENMLV